MAEGWNSRVGLLLLVAVTLLVTLHKNVTDAASVPPGIYLFGDSTVDVGTNNKLSTMARANFPPYGIDYPGSVPTGRFSNGFNIIDFLCKLLGFRSPKSYMELTNNNQTLISTKDAIKGVNFASAGSGILYSTGHMLGEIVSLSEQIDQFTAVHEMIEKLLGTEPTTSFLSKSFFVVSAGSNDIFQNFILNTTSDKQEFVNILESAFENHLRTLYSLGARKFAIMSAPPLGCCPSVRSHSPTGECVDDLNESSQMFFTAVEALMPKLGSELKDIEYSVANTYAMVMDIIENALRFGFTETKSACCGIGKFKGEAQCTALADVCSNRDQHLFWDRYHPSQAAARLGAQVMYAGPPRFVTPINFKQLKG